MKRAPLRFSDNAASRSRSGGLHACTMSKDCSAASLRTSRRVLQRAAPYSRTYPPGPPVAGASGQRWIFTPSLSSKASRSCFCPFGQTTATSKPARRSATHSCQTRRFSGTDKSSTRNSALPGDTRVLLAPPSLARIRQAHQVDDVPAVAAVQSIDVFGSARADDADLGVRDESRGVGYEQRREMRKAALDVLPVRAHEARERDLGVVDPQVEALAQQPFAQLDEGTLAQVVGERLEREPEDAHPPPPDAHDRIDDRLQMTVVRRENRLEDRQGEIRSAGRVQQRP